MQGMYWGKNRLKMNREVNMKKERIDLGIPHFLTIETEDWEEILPGTGVVFKTRDVILELDNPDGEKEAWTPMGIRVTSQTSRIKYIKFRWNQPLNKKSRILGSSWERTYGDARWKGISGRDFMPWYFLASHGERTAGYGVKVRPSAMCFWQADTRGITLILDIRCGGTGVELKGRQLLAAEVLCMEAREGTAFQAAQAFCSLLCTDPLLPPYPVYGSNNWYYAYGNSSEEEILKDTKYLLELTKGAKNPPYMVIDDCWQEHHRLNEYNGGPWRKGNSKFPDMGALAEKIKEKGARPGIWVRLLLNEDEEIPEEWRISHNGCLDPSNPQALAYIQEDVECICKWGYTLIKHDFSTYDIFGRWGFEMNPFPVQDGWSFYNRSLTSADVVKLLYEKIYEIAAKYQTLIIGCNTMGHLGAGLMHMQRTGDDTSGVTWERTRVMGVNTLAFVLPQHRAFYEIDADCVGIMGPIPWELNRQWADLVAKSGTPLFVSAKPGLLSEEEKEELHQIMLEASEQKRHLLPTDWEDTDCPEIWEDEEGKVEYNWYEEAGTKARGNNTLRYFAYNPLS